MFTIFICRLLFLEFGNKIYIYVIALFNCINLISITIDFLCGIAKKQTQTVSDQIGPKINEKKWKSA